MVLGKIEYAQKSAVTNALAYFAALPEKFCNICHLFHIRAVSYFQGTYFQSYVTTFLAETILN
jgi:hypothetical protein